MGTHRTFDQLLAEKTVDPLASPEHFAPHKVIESRLVFEPMSDQDRVRVTARAADFRVLWGVVASKGMLTQHPVPVAFYEALKELTHENLPKGNVGDLSGTLVDDSLGEAAALIHRINELTEKLRVKKVSDATRKRALLFSSAFRDARKLIESYISECET